MYKTATVLKLVAFGPEYWQNTLAGRTDSDFHAIRKRFLLYLIIYLSSFNICMASQINARRQFLGRLWYGTGISVRWRRFPRLPPYAQFTHPWQVRPSRCCMLPSSSFNGLSVSYLLSKGVTIEHELLYVCTTCPLVCPSVYLLVCLTVRFFRPFVRPTFLL